MREPETFEESGNRYPLSYQQMDPDHTERHSKHVIVMALRIRGELRIDALQGALDEVVRRHEALRTRVHYDESDGSLGYQEVVAPLPVPLTVRDLVVAAGRSRDQAAVELYVAMHDEHLDYSHPPSLRATLYRFDETDAVLTLLTHHLYGDNWSMGVLRRDLAACYTARVRGTPHALPPAGRYRDYASWQRGYLGGEKAATARRFWLTTLSGAEMLTLPADRPQHPDEPAPPSAVRNFLVDPDESAKLVAAATRNRCTAWHLFLAAGVALAAQVRGSTDVTLLTVNNGRELRDFQNTVGFFANLVPVRMQAGGCRTFAELMLLARKASVAAHQNQLPFPELLELAPDLLRPFEDPQAMPVAFNYVRPSMALADFQFSDSVEPVVPPDEVPAMYHRGSCTWSLAMLHSGAFRFVVEYEPGMVDTDTVDRWGRAFVDLVLAIADRPDRAWRDR